MTKFKDNRTSLLCKLLHNNRDQILIGIQVGVPYPNICQRCEPDRFRAERNRVLKILADKEMEKWNLNDPATGIVEHTGVEHDES